MIINDLRYSPELKDPIQKWDTEFDKNTGKKKFIFNELNMGQVFMSNKKDNALDVS